MAEHLPGLLVQLHSKQIEDQMSTFHPKISEGAHHLLSAGHEWLLSKYTHTSYNTLRLRAPSSKFQQPCRAGQIELQGAEHGTQSVVLPLYD